MYRHQALRHLLLDVLSRLPAAKRPESSADFHRTLSVSVHPDGYRLVWSEGGRPRELIVAKAELAFYQRGDAKNAQPTDGTVQERNQLAALHVLRRVFELPRLDLGRTSISPEASAGFRRIDRRGTIALLCLGVSLAWELALQRPSLGSPGQWTIAGPFVGLALLILFETWLNVGVALGICVLGLASVLGVAPITSLWALALCGLPVLTSPSRQPSRALAIFWIAILMVSAWWTLWASSASRIPSLAALADPVPLVFFAVGLGATFLAWSIGTHRHLTALVLPIVGGVAAFEGHFTLGVLTAGVAVSVFISEWLRSRRVARCEQQGPMTQVISDQFSNYS